MEWNECWVTITRGTSGVTGNKPLLSRRVVTTRRARTLELDGSIEHDPAAWAAQNIETSSPRVGWTYSIDWWQAPFFNVGRSISYRFAICQQEVAICEYRSYDCCFVSREPLKNWLFKKFSSVLWKIWQKQWRQASVSLIFAPSAAQRASDRRTCPYVTRYFLAIIILLNPAST